MEPSAKGIEIKKSPPLTIHDAVDSRTPELTATAPSIPWRWKKRTRAASVAGVPSARPLKVFPSSSISSGKYGTDKVIEPWEAMAVPK